MFGDTATHVTLNDPDESGMVFSWSPGTFLSAANVLSPDINDFSGEPIDYVVAVNITTLENCVDTAVIHVEYGSTIDMGEPDVYDCDVSFPHTLVVNPISATGNYSIEWYPDTLGGSDFTSTNDTLIVTYDNVYRLIVRRYCDPCYIK